MFLNRVTLMGFVGADAKHRAAQAGKEITRFSLATTKRFKSGNEVKEHTQWHDCVVYSALKAAENIQKGDHVLVEGELRYHEYERTLETPDGPFKVLWPKTEIIASSVIKIDRQAKQNKGAAA